MGKKKNQNQNVKPIQIDTKFDKETGTATAWILEKGNFFEAKARCHPEDIDFCSERTGCYIAELRVHMKYLTHLARSLREERKIIQKTYNRISAVRGYSKGSNYDWNWNKIFDEIDAKIMIITEAYKADVLALHNYIEGKEKSYRLIRSMRANKIEQGE